MTVVVNYRHYDDTLRCVASLQASTHLDHHIIVVDNTEPESRRNDLEDWLDPCVTVIDGGGNHGFAAGCNLGIRAALARDADFVWLVNPDAVVAPDTLSTLLAAAEEHADAGIIGSRIIDGGSPPRILFNGGQVDAQRKGATSHHDQGRLDSEVPDVVRDVDYVTGACFLVRRAVLRNVGLLPEEYFLYYEETDYCLQVRASGWRAIIAPHARTWHFKRSTGHLPAPYYIYYMCRNRVHFSQRFFSASYDECKQDMSPFVDGWRKRVQARAPHLLDRYDTLTEIAFEDARSGRLGRRDDIGEFAFV